MNNRGAGPPLGADQSALSLLVNAADSHNPPRDGIGGGVPAPGRSLADTLRLRGLAGDGGTAAALEEQLLLQQQSALQQQNQLYGNPGLLSQIRDQNLLSQLGQQQQLASLLGLGAPAPAAGAGSDMRSALAAAQLRQQAQAQAPPQLSQADLLTLSRSGGLSGLAGLGALGGAGAALSGAAGGAGAASLASELEGLQRLEELERQQRLLSASSGGAPLAPASVPRLDASQLPSLAAMEQQARQAPPSAPAPGGGAPPADPLEVSSASPVAPPKPEKEASDAIVSGTVPDVVPKDEVEKAPGSVIVPCRARGMPMDHNFKTAYFVIPENVKHGEELICSYFACRNAGIKFRYCSHCKVPVAKRNFRKRHKHGREIVAGEDSCGEDEDPSYKKDIPSQIMAGREEDGLSSQTGDSTNQNDKPVSTSDVQKGLVRNSMRTFEDSKHSQAEDVIPGAADKSGEKISSTRKQRWARLLAKRPSTNDGDSMSNWLMEVLAVSDLETPLKAAEDTEAAPAPPPPAAAAARDPPVPGLNGAGAPKEVEAEGDFAVVKKKKKRSSDIMAQNGEPEGRGEVSGSYAGGSFAEWKERKKQRKQSKSEEFSEE